MKHAKQAPKAEPKASVTIIGSAALVATACQHARLLGATPRHVRTDHQRLASANVTTDAATAAQLARHGWCQLAPSTAHSEGKAAHPSRPSGVRPAVESRRVQGASCGRPDRRRVDPPPPDQTAGKRSKQKRLRQSEGTRLTKKVIRCSRCQQWYDVGRNHPITKRGKVCVYCYDSIIRANRLRVGGDAIHRAVGRKRSRG